MKSGQVLHTRICSEWVYIFREVVIARSYPPDRCNILFSVLCEQSGFTVTAFPSSFAEVNCGGCLHNKVQL